MSNTPKLKGRRTRDARCEHNLVLCSKCVVVTDAARKMADAVGLAILSNPIEVLATGWMAFALQDGTTDHVVYPTKEDAIRHMSNEFRYCYLNLTKCLGAPPAKDMQLYLDLHRHIYKQGGRLTDPNSDIIMPQARDQLITVPVMPTRAEIMRNHWDVPFKPNGKRLG